ncbi:MAG: FHA domain-containing protein [Verrucomicrobiota bacterium]
MAVLTVQLAGGEPAYYQFEEPQVTIGRGKDNSIVVDHESISASHAQFVRNEDGSYTLMDLGSSNGTFLEGQAVSQQVLPDTGNLQFGHIAAYWQTHGELAPAPVEEESASGMSMLAPDFVPMGRPANFVSISPHKKNRKKSDPAAGVAGALGAISILTSLGLIAAVFLLLK